MFKSTKKIKIQAADSNQRIDVFLTSKITELSRSAIQKLIAANQVFVNKKPINKHYNLKTEDIIELKTEQIKAVLKPTKTEKKLPAIEIIKKTKDFIIINKPAGLVVHADSAHTMADTLIGQVIAIYPKIKKLGDNPLRPGVVHRLDNDVSGLMVIAHSQPMYDHLKAQFKARKIDKEYTALTHGVITKDEDEINFPITRKKSGFMAAVPKGTAGREATTKIKVVKRYHHYTLIKARLITGRTHQIRVHLAAYGHPIVGEKIYISKKPKKMKIQGELNRLFLHSTKLCFTDLAGVKNEFTAKLPNKLESLIKKIK